MALEGILNVTVGLTLFWLVLSLVIYQLTESMSTSQFRTPQQELRKAIGDMLQDVYLLNKFYGHRIIRELTPKGIKPALKIPAHLHKFPIARSFAKTRDIFPSIITAEDFADAMFKTLIYDSLSPEEIEEGLSIARMKTSIERLQARKLHLADTLDELFPGLDRPGILEQKIAECKAEIKRWYRRGTANVEESRRRVERRMALGVALILVLFFNIDAIQMASYFWREPTIREVLVQNAANFELPQEEFQANSEEALQNFNQQFVGLQIPIGWSITQYGILDDPSCQLFPRIDQSFGIPFIGIPYCLSQSFISTGSNLVLKLFGLLISAVAGQQGAPLWSNIVKRLAVRVQQV